MRKTYFPPVAHGKPVFQTHYILGHSFSSTKGHNPRRQWFCAQPSENHSNRPVFYYSYNETRARLSNVFVLIKTMLSRDSNGFSRGKAC